jgi:hypothetical protein
MGPGLNHRIRQRQDYNPVTIYKKKFDQRLRGSGAAYKYTHPL